MRMDASDGLCLIRQAIEKEEEAKAWEVWVSAYPHMGENFTPFDQFLADIKAGKQKNEPQLTADEAIAKAEKIRMAHQGKGGRSSGAIQDVW